MVSWEDAEREASARIPLTTDEAWKEVCELHPFPEVAETACALGRQLEMWSDAALVSHRIANKQALTDLAKADTYLGRVPQLEWQTASEQKALMKQKKNIKTEL